MLMCYLMYMNCNEKSILIQFLLRYDVDDYYAKDRCYYLQLAMMINKDIKEGRITNVLLRLDTTMHVASRGRNYVS